MYAICKIILTTILTMVSLSCQRYFAMCVKMYLKLAYAYKKITILKQYVSCIFLSFVHIDDRVYKINVQFDEVGTKSIKFKLVF